MSNQVYRDKANAIPYNGELTRVLITLTGSAAGSPTGQIAVNFVRVSPTIAGMQIVSASVGVLWNNGLVIAAGANAIPADFAPALNQAINGISYIPGPVNVYTLFDINSNGSFTITHPDPVTGLFAGIPNGTTFANQLLLWCTDAI